MLRLITLSVLLAVAPALAVWPLPQHYSNGSTALRLSSTFYIQTTGIKSCPQDLEAAIQRTTTYLHKDQLQALVPDRGASSAQAIKAAHVLQSLTLSLEGNSLVRSISEEAVVAVESRVEGYKLTIPADGKAATLTANSTLGLFRGLTTFSQLWYEWQGSTYTLQAPFDITDFPAYVRSLPIPSNPKT